MAQAILVAGVLEHLLAPGHLFVLQHTSWQVSLIQSGCASVCNLALTSLLAFRSTQLPTGGPAVPTAGTLVTLAMQLLRKSGGVMPCNRVAVSTTDFLPLYAAGTGHLADMFAGKAAAPKVRAAAPRYICIVGKAACLVLAALLRCVFAVLQLQSIVQSLCRRHRRLKPLLPRASQLPSCNSTMQQQTTVRPARQPSQTVLSGPSHR
jgi:hypothetical protein